MSGRNHDIMNLTLFQLWFIFVIIYIYSKSGLSFLVGGGQNIKSYCSGQIITTSAEVTLNGGLVRELPQNPLNSGLGIILICPDCSFFFFGGGVNSCLCYGTRPC